MVKLFFIELKINQMKMKVICFPNVFIGDIGERKMNYIY